MDKSNTAIQGYDPVSYFTSGKPEKGNKQFQVENEEVVYWFKSQRNAKIFKENPEKYIPVYGGWCAYAMGANGTKVKIDPETFKILSGRLYLFYNFSFTNTLDKWNEQEVELNKAVDKNWASIISPLGNT